MAHQQDFGTPTPSPRGSKEQRKILRDQSKHPLLLKNSDRTKIRITWRGNPWCWLYEKGEWTRHCNPFSKEKWESVANDLEMLIITGISRREIAEKAEVLRKLNQNRQQYTSARWNHGKY